MRDLDLLVIGGAGIDTIVHVDSLPVPAADSTVIVQVPVTSASAANATDPIKPAATPATSILRNKFMMLSPVE